MSHFIIFQIQEDPNSQCLTGLLSSNDTFSFTCREFWMLMATGYIYMIITGDLVIHCWSGSSKDTQGFSDWPLSRRRECCCGSKVENSFEKQWSIRLFPHYLVQHAEPLTTSLEKERPKAEATILEDQFPNRDNHSMHTGQLDPWQQNVLLVCVLGLSRTGFCKSVIFPSKCKRSHP